MPPPPAPRGTVAAGPRRRRSPETPVPGQSRPGIPRESRAASAPACGTRGVRGIGVWSAPREMLEPRSRAGRQRTRPSPSAVDSTPLEGREGREHRVRPRGPAPRTRAPGSPPASRRRGPAPPPRPRGQVWARRRLLSLFSLFLHSCGWKRLYSPKKRCPHLPGRSFRSKKKKGAEEDDCELELTSCCLRLGGPIPPPTPPTSFPATRGGAACLPRRHRPSSRWAESGRVKVSVVTDPGL